MLQLINFLLKGIIYFIVIIFVGIPLIVISIITWNYTYLATGEFIVNFIFTIDKLKSKGIYDDFTKDFYELIHKYKL